MTQNNSLDGLPKQPIVTSNLVSLVNNGQLPRQTNIVQVTELPIVNSMCGIRAQLSESQRRCAYYVVQQSPESGELAPHHVGTEVVEASTYQGILSDITHAELTRALQAGVDGFRSAICGSCLRYAWLRYAKHEELAELEGGSL